MLGTAAIIAELNVRGRHVPGLLAPEGQTALPDDDELIQNSTDTEDGKAEAVPQNNRRSQVTDSASRG